MTDTMSEGWPDDRLKSVQHAIAAGELLIEAKDQVLHVAARSLHDYAGTMSFPISRLQDGHG